MAFSPEHFITDAGSPVEWARLRSQSMQQMGEGIATRRREAEQKRQFDLTAEESQRQFGLNIEQTKARLAFDRAKLANEAYEKRVARHIEAQKLIREADKHAKGVDDFNVNAQMISSSHRIVRTPMGSVPPEMARGLAAETPDVPDPAAPVGTAPVPGQVAPPAPAQGAGIPPGTEDATVAGDEHFGAPGTVPPTVTTAADTVAAVAMGAEEKPPEAPDKLPLDPADAATATEAAAADAANPVVPQAQDVPAESPHEEALRRMRNQKPVMAVEAESRANTEAQIAADMEQRAKIIRGAGLSPIVEATALNMARGALGLPPMPVPKASVQDPNVPPEAQGSGEWEVLIPPEIEALAKAPPKLKSDTVRDAMQSGGWDYWDMDTGEYLWSDDWEATQESRMEFMRQGYATLSSMGSNPQEIAQIENAVEAVVRTGSEKPFDVLSYMWRMKGQQAAAGFRTDANDRAMRAEERAILHDAEVETSKLIAEQRENAMLDTMHANLQTASRALEALRGEPGDRTSTSALKQREVMANHLKTLMGSRSTDQDARLALDTNFAKKVKQWVSYVAGTGEMPDEYLDQLEGVIQELEDDELEKAHKTAGRLYEVIVENLTVMQLSPNLADHQARQAIKRQIPELNSDVVDEIAKDYQKKERKPLLVPNWSMGGSSSSSSSSKSSRGGRAPVTATDDELEAFAK